MDLSLQIDVVDNISKKDFNNIYFRQQTPLIIKGLTEKTIAGKKWCIDYFKKDMGDFLVDIYDNTNDKSSASAYTKPDFKMKFADYLDIIAHNKRSDLRIFLFNIFKYNPKLSKEFPCPEIFKGMMDHLGFMFFGGKDTTVRIHYDIDMSSVLHTHFGGKKRVVLIEPNFSELLYRLPFNTYSLVNIDNPDYQKYPALKYVKGYEVILEPGDSIFIPSGYWHYMTYLEGSFSVSYRKLSPNLKHSVEGIINLALYMPFDKIINGLFGKKWLKVKNNIAQKNADNIIEKPFFNYNKKYQNLN